MSRAATNSGAERRCRYRGVRRRAWGKWVSEIRVPGTRERLWLGSYAAPEAAAVAHDAAACLLRGCAGRRLNFPGRAACYYACGGQQPLSPRSVQRVASDAGMAADAQIVDARAALASPPPVVQPAALAGIIGGAAREGGGGVRGPACAPAPPSNGAGSSSTYWSTPSSEPPLVYGDISVDDIEILI
ncbi:ethylene-responsive transcription factor ERF020 [Zea mays]|uniref:Putative AP2/EREBP transcription factor superfamily protein n=1 Tax=Zea mays TaxID=4577 RepID=A0A1D6M4K2_MAIZE|nr:ethylene-responsive transcription factor ERF020 [Zea mays]AQK86059.1 Putative AP2/EREBP transcription factor superfamily protein [Zea mays]|eukprot:XP_008649655.1 ethylene-responsive transcription factor ERF020 [Zea mays]